MSMPDAGAGGAQRMHREHAAESRMHQIKALSTIGTKTVHSACRQHRFGVSI
ncbi:hypothetical protein ACKI2N_011685 [Cupriavidus sp. 30B13]|uniref:hypothetical protein n=1 Tax=Cupriavidus sp. 30B13 TaxID=3384241 RepID=UPI003B906C23